MYYTKIIFNSGDWKKLTYSFKLNMLCRELEIIYDNFLGGYTTKGIKLNRNQYAHLKQLLKIENFKKYRDNLNIDNYISLLDTYRWSLQCISNDGEPMLEIPNRGDDYIMPPDFVINLVEYIAEIGIEPELIPKMRLF
ncbi:hypothetical protein [Clostridium chauvoei]|uniref:Uncharacterized protein n=2 Tax=Clostridium chauvoei TaxID=46867 RepID=A0A1U6JRB3_9CLOT|nr:hypothetical protein [Clostridium chauvoei]ATD54101.1 hypothetical protein BTM20_02150 [Clostridium chauvoei]ATD58448.1 hypothetical protein BTM21_12300 [Clostridium chauvoei]MBX7281584.1 hypothetical protein [Clostridium chauvoei]MBX7284104.1 hypothetical protein [Clostridium chauvoei]MBX7286648.1 hypothetical protein [Clostridium chauvoei]